MPAGVDVSIPLQSYFRLNAPGAGQFEHTMIIVEKGAKVHFIEGCSAPKYNVANLHAGCVELFIGDDAELTYSTIENWSKNMSTSIRSGPSSVKTAGSTGSRAPSVPIRRASIP